MKFFVKKFVVAAFLLSIFCYDVIATPPTATVSTVLEPTLDTYIMSNDTTANRGGYSNLYCYLSGGNTYKSLLKFDMPSGTVTSASLQLSNGSSGSWSKVDIVVVSGGWTESANWSTDNGKFTSTSAGSRDGTNGLFILSNFGGLYGLTPNSSGCNYSPSSKDNTNTAIHPKLSVTYQITAPIGDSNLDGKFNSSDLVLVYQAGKYETMEAATWAQGDWNEDGVFDSGDLVTAFQAGTYETGAAALEADWDEISNP